jgi:hypothetical protein
MQQSGRARRIKTIHVIGMNESTQDIQRVVPDGRGGILSGLQLAQQPRRRLNMAKLAGTIGQGPPDWGFEPSRRVTAVLILPSDVASVEPPPNAFNEFVLDFVSVLDKHHPDDPLHPLFDLREHPADRRCRSGIERRTPRHQLNMSDLMTRNHFTSSKHHQSIVSRPNVNRFCSTIVVFAPANVVTLSASECHLIKRSHLIRRMRRRFRPSQNDPITW